MSVGCRVILVGLDMTRNRLFACFCYLLSAVITGAVVKHWRPHSGERYLLRVNSFLVIRK